MIAFDDNETLCLDGDWRFPLVWSGVFRWNQGNEFGDVADALGTALTVAVVCACTWLTLGGGL